MNLLRLLATVCVALMLVACGQAAAPSAGQAVEGGIITRALTTEPTGLDPHGPPGSGQNILLPYLFDTLVFKDADNTLHPFLAESWEIAPDNSAITFDLRQGITFHDGTPLDAEAVVFSFERFRERGAGSPIAGDILSITAIEALDDDTVRFSFDDLSASFLSSLTMPYAGIVSPTAIEQAGDSFAQNPVGSGPFMLEEWQPGIAIRLARNPAYTWGPPVVANQGPPHIAAVEFTVIPDASTQLAALQAGEVDLIFVNQPGHILRLQDNPQIRQIEVTLNSLVYLGFNTQKAPFDDVRVRRALSHAVNKAEIVQTALGGLGQVAFAPMAPSLPGFDPALQEYALEYDPDRARELLIEAGFAQDAAGGWSRGVEQLRGVLLTSTRSPNADVATVLQSQFSAIGVPVEIQQLDAPTAMKTANEGNFDLWLWRYDWNDPDILNVKFASEYMGQTNRVFYSNPEVDQLLEYARVEMDPLARSQLYVEAQKLIMADAVWQPLYTPVDVIAVHERVENIVVGSMGRVLLNDARVTQ